MRLAFGKNTPVTVASGVFWPRYALEAYAGHGYFTAWLHDRRLVNRQTWMLGYGIGFLRSNLFVVSFTCGRINEGDGPKIRIRIPLRKRATLKNAA